MKSLFLVSMAIAVISTHAQDGLVDDSFAGGAVQSLINPTELGSEFITHLEVQDDDKIVIAGMVSYQEESEVLVSRLMPDGSLDTGFGDAGYTILNLTVGPTEWLTGLALQGDKIIISGSTSGAINPNFFAVRLNSDGSLDENFGSLGATYVDLNDSNEDICNTIEIDDQNRILLAGWSSDEFNAENAAIVRLTEGGQLDTDFSDDGILIWSISSQTDEISDILFNNNGDIMVLGSAVSSGQPNLLVGAIDDDGNKILSYGTNGRVLHAYNDDAFATNVGLLHDNGDILIVGHLPNFKNVSIDVATVMIDDAGELVDTWGIGGLQTFDFSLGGSEIVYDALRVDDQYILAGGKVEGDFSYNSFITRLNGDGTADEDFGEFGTTSVDVSQLDSDVAYAIAPQGNGLIVAGTANSANGSYGYVFRLLNDFGINVDETVGQSFAVYPNPVVNSLRINNLELLNQGISIYGSSGKQVIRIENNQQPTIDVSDLTPGNYIILLDDGTRSQFIKR